MRREDAVDSNGQEPRIERGTGIKALGNCKGLEFAIAKLEQLYYLKVIREHLH